MGYTSLQPYLSTRHAVGAGRPGKEPPMKAIWMYGGLLALLALGQVPWAEALWCENRVVSEGDSSFDVLAKCGPPTAQSQRLEELLLSETVFQGGQQVVVTRRILVPVDVWLYNFGPHRLLYELLFRDDRLKEIRTRGYGYDEAQ
jgi:Protein of unknown function (DUF2845)